MKLSYRVFFVLLCFVFFINNNKAQKATLNDYNLIWKTPGVNSQGSIPLGNGDIGVNAWVEDNGDLVFYVSKTDSWSENGQLLKLGKIRVSLTPNPYNKDRYIQELKLQNGELLINYGQSKIRLWVDANHPTIQIDIDSKIDINAKVSLELWRKLQRQIKGSEAHTVYGVINADTTIKGKPLFQEPDNIVSGSSNEIIWYHHNKYSHWHDNLELLSLTDYANDNTDPLLDRTFGAMIEANGFINKSDTVLVSKTSSKHFQVNIYPLTLIGSQESMIATLDKTVIEINNIPAKERIKAHYKWWQQFWDRNYIYITTKDTCIINQVETVTQGYILQRYINACGGRGNYPIKFNGTIFTVDNLDRKDKFKGYDADYRQWGGAYWFQNTRLPYWSMLVSGDFDMMKPLFNMYLNCLPIRKLATKEYYNHEGAFFPETMNFWGTHTSENYGFNRTHLTKGLTQNRYIRYYWTSGLELSLMMLDYYSFTHSNSFAKDTLMPLTSEILTFFDKHWQRGIDGKILFSPAQSLETFHKAVNPAPEIVALKTVCSKMLALPQLLTTENQRHQWEQIINDLPEIPLKIINNKDTILAPAVEYSEKSNIENPELYAIFPYRLYTVTKPDLALALRTFDARQHKENGGWQQNSIQAAYLGLTDEAKRMVVESFSSWDKNFRFPAFWGPNYDWTPDQDHGNVAMIALQRMLIQYEDDNIYMFTAWPKEWDVRFKVNAPGNTTVEGVYRNGKVVKMKRKST